MNQSRPGAKAGFTLFELLLAIFLAGALIVAVTTFIFSMGELWGRGADERLFDQHVRGVTRFLSNAFESATVSTQQNSGGDATTPTTAVYFAAPAGGQYGSDQLLTFELPESPGVLVWPDGPLPFVVCSLYLDPGNGLFLLWKSRLEPDFGQAAPRETLLSPYVTAITYSYYDATNTSQPWTTSPTLETDSSGNAVVPARVELTFQYEKMTRTTEIVVPSTQSGAPVY